MYKLFLTTLMLLFIVALPAFAQDGGFPVQLEGTIEAVEEDTITVDGFVLDISQLELETPLEVDMVVAIEGELTDGDVIIVTELTILETPPLDVEAAATIEFAGVVDSYEDMTIVVNGLTIDVSQAEIDDDIAEDDVVKLYAADGVVIGVERIDLDIQRDGEDEPPEFKLTDFVERSGENHVVMSGVTVIAIGEGDIETGALIKVEGIIIEDVLIASEIEVFEHADRDPEFDIRGIVQEIEDDTMVVSGVEITIEAVEADVEVGNRVHVRGSIEDNDFIASEISRFGNPNGNPNQGEGQGRGN